MSFRGQKPEAIPWKWLKNRDCHTPFGVRNDYQTKNFKPNSLFMLPNSNIKYSIIVPAHNEQDTVVPLYEAVKRVMDSIETPSNSHVAARPVNTVNPVNPVNTARSDETPSDSPLSGGETAWELIFIDDGSVDETYKKLKELHEKDPRVKIIRFRRQFGQTAAWSAGFDYANGEYVIVMDADMQNDPKDIPAMIKKLNTEHLDVVSGWRKNRKDKNSYKVASWIGNVIHRWITGEKIHDHGCSLKVYRKEALVDLELYGEMHRYITALLSWKGFKVGEMVVNHQPRRHGKTNYSFKKKLKGFLDLVVVKFWIQYSARPMHFFGAIGASFIIGGFLLGGTLGVLWLLRLVSLAGRNSPLLAVLLVLLGFQFLLTGVLADVVAHTYYAQKKVYSIKSLEGFDTDNNPPSPKATVGTARIKYAGANADHRDEIAAYKQ